MTLGLSLLVVALIGVAIAIQVFYLRGLAKSGIEVTRAVKAICYTNIVLLSIVALGVLVFGVLGQLTAMGA
jgi:hypothetical protein